MNDHGATGSVWPARAPCRTRWYSAPGSCSTLASWALRVVLCVVPCIAGSIAATDAEVGWDGKTYVLSVAEMQIAYDADPNESTPDIVVRVVRSNPTLNDQIDRLESQTGRLRSQLKVAAEEQAPLKIRLTPKEPPLTATQTARLEALLLDVGLFCGTSPVREWTRDCRRCPEKPDFETCYRCAKCPELELLQRRKHYAAPLSEEEGRYLQALEEKYRGVDDEYTETFQRLKTLRSESKGTTAQIRTAKHSVHFGDVPIVNVYADDEIDVSIWDEDPFSDDLYGRETVRLDQATLDGGTLDIRMRNIEFVRLNFRRLGDSR